MRCRLKVVTYNKYKQDTYGITTGVMPNNCNAVTIADGISRQYEGTPKRFGDGSEWMVSPDIDEVTSVVQDLFQVEVSPETTTLKERFTDKPLFLVANLNQTLTLTELYPNQVPNSRALGPPHGMGRQRQQFPFSSVGRVARQSPGELSVQIIIT
jgi:hypothetical protein